MIVAADMLLAVSGQGWPIWAAVVVTALSGYFALNGYALRAASRRELESVFGHRSQKRAGSLPRLRGDLQLVCSLMRSLCNLALLVLLLYVLGYHAAPDVWSILWAVIICGLIISVFVEGIPYAWARYAGPKVLNRTAGSLMALRLVLWPVLMLMRAFDLPVRRLSGVPDPEAPAEGATGEGDSALGDAVRAEILQVASDGHAEGAVDVDQMEMIESVIGFGDRRAGEVMTPRIDIVALPQDAGYEQVRQTIISAGHTRFPVYVGDIDNIVGILHAKDLLAVPDPARLDLRKIIRKPLFLPETKRLDDLLAEFKVRKVHMAIVLDEYGGTAGMVTVEDVVEEIVGDIADEYDVAESALMRRIDERSLEVDGRLNVSELNDLLGIRVPEDRGYDTVAGLVFSELGFVPLVGEVLQAHGAIFTVLAADPRKITRLRVEKAQPKEEEA